MSDHLEQAPATAAADRGTCAQCPASAEGCAARQASAIRQRCCWRCSHDEASVDPPGRRVVRAESIEVDLLAAARASPPADRGHTPPGCAGPFCRGGEVA